MYFAPCGLTNLPFPLLPFLLAHKLQYLHRTYHKIIIRIFGSMSKRCMKQCTVEPPLTDILYSGHLTYTGQNVAVRIDFTALRNADTSLFRKADRFCSPASAWTVQNSLDNADAGRPLAQDCPAPLIDSPTGHCTNTGMHSFSLWLFFAAIVQQGRAVERAFVALNGTSTHCHAYRKYTGNLRSKNTSLLRTL